jgi:hypothetical protein
MKVQRGTREFYNIKYSHRILTLLGAKCAHKVKAVMISSLPHFLPLGILYFF